MRLVVLAAVVALVVLSTLTSSADGRRRNKKNKSPRPHRRGCHRNTDADVNGSGGRYVWTLSGFDDNNLQVTFTESAFAPSDSTTVFKYPLHRGQRSLGLFPAKVFYDFSNPDAPVSVIRHGRRGRGFCIVVETPDVDTYQQMIDLLGARNGTNGLVPGEQDTLRLVATRAANDSQFSAVVRDLCSQDPCGRPLPATYFVADPESEVASASPAPALVSDDDDDSDDDNDDDVSIDDNPTAPPTDALEPTFLMMNTRVTITGLPDRQQQRWERRQQRRQERRKYRQSRRENRRRRRTQQRPPHY